nr:hypothetical protein [Phaeacidiphilus oryzae]
MTARKPPVVSVAELPACTVCHGSGTVAKAVRVGRRHRVVGHQEGACLHCWGTGTEPDMEGEQ